MKRNRKGDAVEFAENAKISVKDLSPAILVMRAWRAHDDFYRQMGRPSLPRFEDFPHENRLLFFREMIMDYIKSTASNYNALLACITGFEKREEAKRILARNLLHELSETYPGAFDSVEAFDACFSLRLMKCAEEFK